MLPAPAEAEDAAAEAKAADRTQTTSEASVIVSRRPRVSSEMPPVMPSFDVLDVNKDGLITRTEYEKMIGLAAARIQDEEDVVEPPLETPVVAKKHKEEEEPAPPESTGKASDILQFDAGVYYVEEEEGAMTLDVMRLGSMEGECSVKYKTMDGSAIAGQRYEAVSGELHFADKEVSRSIQIPILDNNGWSTTLEFKLLLYEPVGCELGRYLYMSRVKVIDGDTFPTNKYNEQIKAKGLENLTRGKDPSVNPSDLLIEYFKLNYSVGSVKQKTWATFTIDQLQNLYFLLTINLLKYVADDVLGPGAQPANFLVANNLESTLLAVGALYLVPYGILNLLDIWKAKLGLAEESKAYLRENMFRKFMNYDDSSRNRVPSSERVMAMTKDVDDMVESGYMKGLEILKSIGKLGVSSFFILQENPEGLAPITIFALATGAFVVTKGEESVRVQEAISQNESRIVSTVQDSTAKYRLIADYLMRPIVQERIDGQIEKLTEASIPVTTLECTNDYFPGWLANVLTASYIIYGGQLVVAGQLQIGAFLATSGVIKDVGESFKDIFTSLLSISKAVEPMQDVSLFMNLPTDLRGMKKINRQRRRRTKQERTPDRLAELRRATGVRYATDAIPIAVDGVTFSYPGAETPAIKSFKVTVPQGALVAVVGPRREGKSTIMRLLGMVLTPSEGEIFVPAHLRILHVTQTPTLLNASPWENLAIGRQYWKDAEFESHRVVKICKRLGLNYELIRHLEETRQEFLETGTTRPPKSRWIESLSSSDSALIHVGRALIYNPEVLVVHRPTLLLSGRSADAVLEMLREFVDNRGIELPADPLGRRRPRTAFASFARSRGVELADVVWGVNKGVVSEIAKATVSDLLLT